ncbi:MAG: hypothetical protein AAFQ82_17660 [Myxococcota bacterium]
METARIVGVTLLASVLLACGTDTEANVAAELGWSFDYADYTSSAPADLRNCDNGANSPITSVRLRAVDPEGQIQGFDTTYECDEGIDTLVQILGVPPALFDLTAEALAGSTVFYRLSLPNFDFSSAPSETLALQAAVGELRFRPSIEGLFDCNPSIVAFEVDLFALEAGVPASSASVSTRFETPCEGSFLAQLQLFDIPAIPQEGNNGFVLPRYEVSVRAVDGAGEPIACADFERAIPPGAASAVGGDEDLTAADCP